MSEKLECMLGMEEGKFGTQCNEDERKIQAQKELIAKLEKEINDLKGMKIEGEFRACIRASVDALCRDGAGEISRDRLQRGPLTRQGTTS